MTDSSFPAADNVAYHNDNLPDVGQAVARGGDAMDATKEVPYNIDLEAALLGALLRNNDLYGLVAETVASPDYFYQPLHRRIFHYFMELQNKGQLATPATMRHLFHGEEAGGVDVGRYLAGLVSHVPSLVNVRDYAAVVSDLFRKRQLIMIGEDMIARARDLADNEATSSKQIEHAEQQLFQLAEYGVAEKTFNRLSVFGAGLIQEIEKRRQDKSKYAGVPTGFPEMDDFFGGLNPSDLFILAARPGMGKTAFAVSLAAQVAGIPLVMDAAPEDDMSPRQSEKKRVLFFSLEMSAEQLTNRILCQMTGVSSISVRREMSDDDFQKFCRALNDLKDSNLYIDDSPSLSITAMRQRARRAKRTMGGLDLIVVDYLQLLQPSGLTRHDNRVAEVTEISRGLKVIAKELHVPVIALSQLSRDVEKRSNKPTGKTPQLSDLRDSGSIEQDADIVAFLYREAYYLKNEKPETDADEQRIQARLKEVEHLAELIIAKHRHGPTDKIPFHFNSITSQFSSIQR
ncbi:MAG: replicative DNA helicase, partial [Hydrotalea sp.]|nr:replicative DNA helicase [Hydrotalea sp.]